MPLDFQKALLSWYDVYKRDLPWRKTQDPYRIWISEMMLQQTQVSTVLGYYRRFLKAFPTVRKLAASSEQHVLKLWEGLGYYTRARNMRKAAQIIVARHAGRIPSEAEALAQLPGIGPYTQGAILSIAFQKPVPLLDGNVTRVLCRVYGIRKRPDTPAVKEKLWELARRLVPKKRPGDFNQSLMELGATLCTKRNPNCSACPLSGLCTARRLGLEEQIPIPVRRARVKKARALIALIQKGNKMLVRKRPSEGLLGGLWEFPQIILRKRSTRNELAMALKRELGPGISIGPSAGTLYHRFTHLDLRMDCYVCQTNGALAIKPGRSHLRWLTLGQLSRIPLSRAHQKIAASLRGHTELRSKM